MGSSNADSPTVTAEEFTARYGKTPQTYALEVAQHALEEDRIEKAASAYHVAVDAVEALGNQDAINAGSDQTKIQELATAVNIAQARKQELAAFTRSRDAVKAFVAGGSFAEVRGELGREFSILVDNDLIDAEALREALSV